MTRKKLRRQEGQRKRFSGTFVRYGTKPAWSGPEPDITLLLKGVVMVETGELVTDHLWFNLTKGFEALGELSEGDVVYFDARVKSYRAGYRGRDIERALYNPPRIDYKLSHPTKIEKREVGQ